MCVLSSCEWLEACFCLFPCLFSAETKEGKREQRKSKEGRRRKKKKKEVCEDFIEDFHPFASFGLGSLLIIGWELAWYHFEVLEIFHLEILEVSFGLIMVFPWFVHLDGFSFGLL
ncbi:hypothetical protein Dimus_039166 [Dionaea muscipula]